MKLRRGSFGTNKSLLVLVVVAQLGLSACQSHTPGALTVTPLPEPAKQTTTAAPTTTTPTTTVPLVTWTQPVEHLFFHTLVIKPELAFNDPKQGKGFRDYFVTVGEFKQIMEQMYANGWT